MKPFDIELAKQGKPVCLRNGIKARIICFDVKNSDYPIIALVEYGIHEVAMYFNERGIAHAYSSGYDLMMASEKYEGWVNVYYDNDASSHRGCRFIYDTKEQAVKEAGSAYITTVKINWEE